MSSNYQLINRGKGSLVYKHEAIEEFGVKDLQRALELGLQDPIKAKLAWTFPFTSEQESVNTNNETLIFNSHFESGNLRSATKVSDVEYKLILKNDALTKGNTQWFYFKVSNTRKGKAITFHIVNFVGIRLYK